MRLCAGTRYSLRSCSRRMSACPQCWASSRSMWRYTQRSGSGPRRLPRRMSSSPSDDVERRNDSHASRWACWTAAMVSLSWRMNDSSGVAGMPISARDRQVTASSNQTFSTKLLAEGLTFPKLSARLPGTGPDQDHSIGERQPQRSSRPPSKTPRSQGEGETGVLHRTQRVTANRAILGLTSRSVSAAAPPRMSLKIANGGVTADSSPADGWPVLRH